MSSNVPAAAPTASATSLSSTGPLLPRLIRHAHAGHLAELFLLHAVGAIIVIRVFLTLTGFPKLGGNGLHIAHMLWGGFFMLAALLLQLFFLNRQMRFATAVLGGIGFGTFIDELGKFITSDNNYFFQPTFTLLYLLFMALFFAVKYGIDRTPLSPREHAANAMNWLMASTYQPLDRAQRAELQTHIDQAQWPEETLHTLRALAADVRAETKTNAGLYTRTRQRLDGIFKRMVTTRPFKVLLIGFFLIEALGALALAVLFVFLISSGTGGNASVAPSINLTTALIPGTLPTAADASLSVPDVAALLTSVVQMVLTVIGVIRLPRHLVAGLHWFKRALVVEILFGQPFAFYFNQLSAVSGLIVALLLYNAISYLIAQHDLQQT